MIKALVFIQKKLSLMIPVFMAAGFALGMLMEDPAPLKAAILPLTFLMVYPMMVSLQIGKIFEGGDVKVQITAQLINFLVIPFAAFAVGRIFFPQQPYYALGFLLVSLLPTSGMTISWTGMSRGNMPAAVKMTVFGLLLGAFAAPLYVKQLMGAAVSIPVAKIFTQIGIIVLLPLAAGFFTQKMLIRRFGEKKYNADVKKKFPPFSTLGVVLMVFVAMALKAESIVNDPAGFLSLIPPLLLLYIFNILFSTFIGKRFFSRGDGLALVYGTVLRNLSIALAIAMTSFGSEGASIALVIALGYIIQIQVSAFYVRFSDRIFGPPETADLKV